MDKAPDAFRTISEVADDLDVPQHVLRFWETRFPQIKPMKRGGGRRYYRPDDVDLLRGIRHLLYGEGYTIRGVQRLMKDSGAKFVQAAWRPKSPVDPKFSDATALSVDAAPSLAPEAAGAASTDNARLAAPWPRANKTFTPPAAGESPQPSEVSPPVVASSEPMRETGLSREEKQSLQAVLDDLTECRRLLDEALKDD